jgi:hypothetical protein
MTGSPDFKPSHKDDQTSKNVPSQVPPYDLLSLQGLSASPLSKEYLLNSDLGRLSAVIERTLVDVNFLNEFVGYYQAACRDSTVETMVFRHRMCQVISALARKQTEAGSKESYATMSRLSIITQSFLDDLEHNPTAQVPTSLNELVHTCVGVLQGLAKYRRLVRPKQPLEAELAGKVLKASLLWSSIYEQNLDHVIRGCEISGLSKNPELNNEVASLVEMQFEWKHESLDPLRPNNEMLIEIWTKTFDLAGQLGDYRFADSIIPIAKEFLERSLSEEPNVVVSELDSDEQISHKISTAGALDKCESAALNALAHCQYKLDAAPVWKRILAEGSFMSAHWRLALVALADLDPELTAPYLAELLNTLGMRPTPHIDRQRLRRSMRHELMAYLRFPGTEDVLVQVFDVNKEIHVKPTRHERLRSLFEKMLINPEEKWSQAALKRLEYALDQFPE